MKYPEMSKKITDLILTGWHSGTPVKKNSVFMMCRTWCKKEDAFYKQYVDPTKATARIQLSRWLARLLDRIGFSSRKGTVSQKIPENWKELSLTFSREVLKYFQENNVDVVVCSDQTFLNYLLEDDKLLVPTGTRRVGTLVEGPDHRKGITLMLSSYAEKGDDGRIKRTGVLPPFMVFNGKTGATLDKRYGDWSRRPGHCGSFNFQSKH